MHTYCVVFSHLFYLSPAVQEGDRIGPFAVDVQPKRKEEDEKADNAGMFLLMFLIKD